MSGGDGNGPGNTGLGHNGGKPSGNINGSSGSGGGTGGNGADGMTATGFHDPISGGMGISFSGSGSSVTSSGTTGGINNGGGHRQPRFTANVGGWKVGNVRNEGSLQHPVVNEILSAKIDEVTFMVNFGTEKYRVVRNIKTDLYKSTIAEGEGRARDEMMFDQAIAVVKRYQLSKDEKSLLLGASAIIADAGGKLSAKLSEQYKTLANTIANDIKNFQGKKIRSLDDAMKTLNAIIANPSFKLSSADKTAITNALKKLNASDMASKLKNLSKGFGVADIALKMESIRSATYVGIDTGNWKPLGLEVESMVLSGIAGSIAVAIVSAILAVIAVALPATITVAISYMSIILIAYASSFIDADAANLLNKQIVTLFKR